MRTALGRGVSRRISPRFEETQVFGHEFIEADWQILGGWIRDMPPVSPSDKMETSMETSMEAEAIPSQKYGLGSRLVLSVLYL